MRHTDEVRPHLTEARRSANATYLRRRARSAADMLLDIDPAHWDEHTRKVLLHTLPRLARIEPWEIRDLERPDRIDCPGCLAEYYGTPGIQHTTRDRCAREQPPAGDELSPADCVHPIVCVAVPGATE